jgi:hypothetical protein
LSIDDTASYVEPIGPTVAQRVRKLKMALAGELVMDPGIFRSLEDVISVRNALILPPGSGTTGTG